MQNFIQQNIKLRNSGIFGIQFPFNSVFSKLSLQFIVFFLWTVSYRLQALPKYSVLVLRRICLKKYDCPLLMMRKLKVKGSWHCGRSQLGGHQGLHSQARFLSVFSHLKLSDVGETLVSWYIKKSAIPVLQGNQRD